VLWYFCPHPAFRMAPCTFSSTSMACIYESSLSCHFTGKNRRARAAVKTWKRRT
uniref:Uncharacterized protein n=1 Tax=Castor canadensis TaxID=51338 RepID=A0A8C0ZUE0_CASCN